MLVIISIILKRAHCTDKKVRVAVVTWPKVKQNLAEKRFDLQVSFPRPWAPQQVADPRLSLDELAYAVMRLSAWPAVTKDHRLAGVNNSFPQSVGG